MGFTILYWVAFAIGILTGMVIMHVLLGLRTFGTLRVDHSNPEKDIYRFDIDNLDDLSKKKKIILKVDNNANLSQE